MTTQGMKEIEAGEVGSLISRALKEREDEAALEGIANEVAMLASKYPPYPAGFVGHV
jgi:glycine/serine hydroxymethyltransferase